jgi:hypothetical protein
VSCQLSAACDHFALFAALFGPCTIQQRIQDSREHLKLVHQSNTARFCE